MENLKDYPVSNEFKVAGSITLPHEYIVGVAKEVFSKDDLGLDLTNEQMETVIMEFEKDYGPSCAAKGCNLSFEEHQLTLVIEAADLTPRPELQAFLMACEKPMRKDGFAGFAFIPKVSEENEEVT